MCLNFTLQKVVSKLIWGYILVLFSSWRIHSLVQCSEHDYSKWNSSEFCEKKWYNAFVTLREYFYVKDFENFGEAYK
jgi:hypothetical protein